MNAKVVNGISQWSPSVRVDGERLRLTLSCSARLPEVVFYLVAKDADVYEVTRQRLSFEERSLEIVGTDGCNGRLDHGRGHVPRSRAQENAVGGAGRGRRVPDPVRDS